MYSTWEKKGFLPLVTWKQDESSIVRVWDPDYLFRIKLIILEIWSDVYNDDYIFP